MRERKRSYRIEKREAEKRMVLRRLRAAGCPVPAGDDCSPPPDLTIEVCNPEQTRAYDYRTSTECVFAVRIKNNSYARLEAWKFRCRFPWPAPMIWPRIDMKERKVYLLPSGREFPGDTVLNHCIGELGKLEPGEQREGLLLAFSPRRWIAAECLHGSVFPAELSIFDQYGRRHRSFVEMVADCTATIDWAALKRTGKGLYDDGSEPGDITREEVANPWPERKDLRPDPQGVRAR